ncbi:hypothetical protein BGZ67_003922 [Mortierella alpina]|nr:hypothetical protein BGZ67_003922 [Mortierella alpina]
MITGRMTMAKNMPESFICRLVALEGFLGVGDAVGEATTGAEVGIPVGTRGAMVGTVALIEGTEAEGEKVADWEISAEMEGEAETEMLTEGDVKGSVPRVIYGRD